MLYRGMRLHRHTENNGRIRPGGSQIEVVPLYDGTWSYDGTFTHGYSEDNAVRAHHIEPSKWDGCFVSTSRSKEVATFFATSDEDGNFFEGVIYHIDDTLFEEHGVSAKWFADPLYPDEQEVSIRANDGGVIPAEVIVKIEHVTSQGGYRREGKDERAKDSAQ